MDLIAFDRPRGDSSVSAAFWCQAPRGAWCQAPDETADDSVAAVAMLTW